MKKSDLKTGMTVNFRCKENYLVLTNCRQEDSFIEIEGNGRIPFSSINENMMCSHNSDYDIIRIYDSEQTIYSYNLFKQKKSLWKREEEVPEYVEMLEDLGSSIKGNIVKVILYRDVKVHVITYNYKQFWISTENTKPSTKEAYEAQIKYDIDGVEWSLSTIRSMIKKMGSDE